NQGRFGAGKVDIGDSAVTLTLQQLSPRLRVLAVFDFVFVALKIVAAVAPQLTCTRHVVGRFTEEEVLLYFSISLLQLGHLEERREAHCWAAFAFRYAVVASTEVNFG